MSSFHDVRFPLRLAFGASGGPTRRTDITTLSNGSEVRNTPHAHARRRYNAATGVKSLEDMRTLIAFFEARMGQLYAFRFRDPVDHSVSDQFIGRGDGASFVFQCVKTYGDAAAQTQRLVTHPDPAGFVLKKDGVQMTDTDYTLDPLTGQVSCTVPPEEGAVLTASFNFDVAVRFDTDGLSLSLEAFGAGEITSIPLIEVLHHA